MRHPMLEHLDAFVGEWASEATHRLLPETVVHGQATFAWLEGGYFLIVRERNDHPEFPDSLAILGYPDPVAAAGNMDEGAGAFLRVYDSRGYTRHCHLSAAPGVYRWWRDHPGFAQRYTATLSADGDTITGLAELNQDGMTWEEDLWVTYQRLA